MYLKKIEVQGFKSFANKIVFDFHRGITGIVGPNGSGKSNVSDAVRWVLGEQSAKQLRGQNMQDVIFSGTELRKPQGYAFVAITMDNSDRTLTIDFDEVTISRRIYRSGESEYMINNSTCRLKDISELLYDTGIGREGYSIIGQGQVDKILSKKSEDRRELFDEAVGITKYKRRKELAQKKLENERANLLRIGDIIDELEKQTIPLKKQSDTAKRYLKIRDVLKKAESAVFVNEYDDLNLKLSKVDKYEIIAKEDMKQALEVHDELKTRYSELEEKVVQLEACIEEYRKKQAQENMTLHDNESKIELFKEQIKSEKANSEHINSRIINIENDISDKKALIRQYDEKLNRLLKTHEEADGMYKVSCKELEYADTELKDLSKLIEAAKDKMIAAIRQRADLYAQKQKYELILEQGRLKKSEAANKILLIKSEESAVVKRYEDEKRSLDKLILEMDETLSSIHGFEEEKKDCEKRAGIISTSLADMQKQFQTDTARLESMKNLAERYEGYGNSIRHVMDTRDRIGGIYGVVADIIELERKYETAIETALGSRIQNVVTDSEETAKALVEYLKKHKYGRATFLPLSAMQGKKVWNAANLLTEKGVIGIASSLVTTKESFKNVINYLLGRVLVIDNIENAVNFAKKYNYEYRLVTLEGEVINPGGAISGGAFKNENNLLGRKREIEELEKKTADSLKQYERFNEEFEAARQKLAGCKQNLRALNEKRQEQLINKSKTEVLLNSLYKKVEEIRKNSEGILEENLRFDEEINHAKQLEHELNETLKAWDEKNRDTENTDARNNEEFEHRKKLRDELVLKVNEFVLNISNIKQNIEYTKESLSRVKNEISLLESEKEGLDERIRCSFKNIEDKKRLIDVINVKISEIRKEADKTACMMESVFKEKNKKSDELKGLFGENDAASKRIAEIDKELLRLATGRERTQEKISELSSYMWNEYEITYQTACNLDYEDNSDLSFTDGKSLLESDKNTLKKHVEKLKSDIRALGSVNVNAIEDYRELSERYELMKTQHDDIVESEKSLVKIIDELDSGMRKRFMEKFKEIDSQFNKVFKELFGGGSGRLELEEGTDLLEADISIIAQPPGKKLQNMLQLSGGEKALTAISLLFAIQNLKPSPFALLDEIEAALDDSNVDRFAKYLHKLSPRTQFIVITHRRGTMVGSDRLYGITMQEKGVSTLVSVNLVENDLN